ncbi:MAG: alpha-E domain-containing protein [Salaquimonas sp.]
MLGKTAGGLYWMFRNLERSENNARLLEAGFRIALTRSKSATKEWVSVLQAAGVLKAYNQQYDVVDADHIIDFVLRSQDNPSSVLSLVESARTSARLVRAALTREIWESVNECWMNLKKLLDKPIQGRELPDVLAVIRQQSSLVRGALYGTKLRNDAYDFSQLGTYLERADSTARILDVKYYVLLPSASLVGTPIDNVQWETILRSVSANRAYHWLHQGEINPKGIANFLIFDKRFPRSLNFCYAKVQENLNFISEEYGFEAPCLKKVQGIVGKLEQHDIDEVFSNGLHEFLVEFIATNSEIGAQIETDFRFYG